MERRHATPPPLTTLHVSGVSRAERTHRLRPLIADAAAVRPAAVVDVDRFGATAAVKILAAAADAFRAGLASHAPLMREMPTASPWCPSFLGGRRRRQVAGPYEAAVTAAELCRARILDKLDQIAERGGTPPPRRTALRWHCAELLAACKAALGALWAAVDALSPVPARVARRRSAAALSLAAGDSAAPGPPRPAQRSPPAAASARVPKGVRSPAASGRPLPRGGARSGRVAGARARRPPATTVSRRCAGSAAVVPQSRG